MLLELLLMSMAVAATSYTIARAKIFQTHRKWISRKSKWFGQLVNCPYCVSHWLAAGLVVVVAWRPLDVWRPLDYFLGAMMIVFVSALGIGLMNRAFPPKKHEPEPMPIPEAVSVDEKGDIELWADGRPVDKRPPV